MPLPHSIDDSLVRARGALVGALSFARKESTNVKELPEFWPAASMVPVAVKPTPQAPRWCLLLTTSTRPTIDLHNLSYGRRQQRDAQVRRRLYRQVVRSYLKDLAVGSGLPMVVVENTADRVFMNMLRHDLSYNSSFSAGLSLEARKKVELLQFLPATTCSNEEIGCHEASNTSRDQGLGPFQPGEGAGSDVHPCDQRCVLRAAYPRAFRVQTHPAPLACALGHTPQ